MDSLAAWHLIHSRPRQEVIAREHLERQGYTIYLPQVRQPKSTRHTITPLFPRYLFIRLAAGWGDWTPLRSTRGVSSLVRVGMNPATISEQLIDSLKKREDHDGLHTLQSENLKKGERIRLINGPFSDYEGIFNEQRGENRAIILLNMIGQQNKIEVPAESISRF